MLDQWTRVVYLYDLVLYPNPIDGPPVDLEDLLPQVVARWKAGESRKLLQNETLAIRLEDLEVGEKHVRFLFNLADKDVSNAAYADLNDGTVEYFRKKVNQGAAVSAHYVVSRTSKTMQSAVGSPRVYPSVVEHVPRLTSGLVEGLVRQELRQAAKELDLHFVGADRKKRALRPKTEFDGVPATDFIEELKQGRLTGFELVRRNDRAKTRYDDEGFVEEKSRRIELSVSDNVPKNMIDNLILKVKARARKENWDQIRIRYQREDGKPRAAPLDLTGAADQLDERFIRFETIGGFRQPLEQCVTKLHRPMVERMTALLDEF